MPEPAESHFPRIFPRKSLSLACLPLRPGRRGSSDVGDFIGAFCAFAFYARNEHNHCMPRGPSSEDFESMVEALRAEGFSYGDIAKAAHLSRTTVWRLSAGDWRAPSHRTVVCIERAWNALCRDGKGRN